MFICINKLTWNTQKVVSNNIYNTNGKQNTKHKYIRDVQIAHIIQLTCITHGNCTDDTIVGATTCKKNMSQWKQINEVTTFPHNDSSKIHVSFTCDV